MPTSERKRWFDWLVAAFGVYSAVVCHLAGERFASYAIGALVVLQLVPLTRRLGRA